MTKEEIISKIKFTEAEIELIEEIIKFDKKDNKRIIFINILVFILLSILTISVDKINFFHIFSISLFTTSAYTMIYRMSMEKIDNKFKLRKLKLDLKHYNRLLDEIID